MIVDCAIYRDGRRVDEPKTPEAVVAAVHEHDGFVWLGLHDPTAAEFAHVMKVFDLHPLAVEDAIHANQRPKLERYGDTMVVVVKPARYVDSDEVVELGQLMVFLGRDFIITVRYGEAGNLKAVREHLEADPDRLAAGPGVVLHAIIDRVADDYGEVMFGLETDIDQIEQEVFAGPQAAHAERIFKLKREVLDFRRAVEPMESSMAKLAEGVDLLAEDLAPYFRDVHDHVLRVADRLIAVDALLDSALNATVAQVGMRQNDDMRKISAWVAIVAVPTMIAGIYGMNFEHMPELDWIVGYPVALGTMAIACAVLYRNFKRRNWL